jgi:tRNA A37 threonylcarbamoyltransferase TsaD
MFGCSILFTKQHKLVHKTVQASSQNSTSYKLVHPNEADKRMHIANVQTFASQCLIQFNKEND